MALSTATLPPSLLESLARTECLKAPRGTAGPPQRPGSRRAEVAPGMVARPGTSLHRNGTHLDLGPPSACGWLARRADDIGFVKRYSREPWHHGCAAWLDVLQPLA